MLVTVSRVCSVTCRTMVCMCIEGLGEDVWGALNLPRSPIPDHQTPSQSKAHGIQKKAYRVLEEVCASPQGPGARFVESHLDDLKKTLLDSLRSTSSPAKRVRPPPQLRSAHRRMGDAGCGPP